MEQTKKKRCDEIFGPTEKLCGDSSRLWLFCRAARSRLETVTQGGIIYMQAQDITSFASNIAASAISVCGMYEPICKGAKGY